MKLKRPNRPITGKGMESFARKVSRRKLPKPKQTRLVRSYIQNSFNPTQRLLIAAAFRRNPRIVSLARSIAVRKGVSSSEAFEELSRSLDSILAGMPVLRAKFRRTQDKSVQSAFSKALDQIEKRLRIFDRTFQKHLESYRGVFR